MSAMDVFVPAMLIAIPILAGHSQAQEIGQAGRGLVSSERLCTQCHAVQKQQALSPNPNAPPFPAIAAIPGMTAIALSAALTTSHDTMPNIMLEATERADIIAYILSLK